MSTRPTTTTPTHESTLASAGYGCVLCGSPIVRYVSGGIREYVLCPEHGHRFENAEIDASELEAATTHPFTSEHDYALGMLLVTSAYPVARLNGVIYVNDELTVSADGETLLSLRVVAGRLAVSLKVYDGNDVLRAEVVDNEWVFGDPEDVVVEHSLNKLAVSYQAGGSILQVNTARTPLQLNAALSRATLPILVGNKGVSVDGRAVNFIDDGYAGCVLEIDTSTRNASMMPDPRHGGHSIIVTERDPLQRIVKALNAMASLQSHIEDDPFDH